MAICFVKAALKNIKNKGILNVQYLERKLNQQFSHLLQLKTLLGNNKYDALINLRVANGQGN